MATDPNRYIPEAIRNELASSGVAWEAQFGKSVVKLLVERRVCKVFPLSMSGRQAERGLRADLATVRRVIRREKSDAS